MFRYNFFSQLNFSDLACVSLGEWKLHFEDEHLCRFMLFWFPIFRHVGFSKSYLLCFPIRSTLCSNLGFANFWFSTFGISKVLYFELKKCRNCYFRFSTFSCGKLKNLDFFMPTIFCLEKIMIFYKNQTSRVLEKIVIFPENLCHNSKNC